MHVSLPVEHQQGDTDMGMYTTQTEICHIHAPLPAGRACQSTRNIELPFELRFWLVCTVASATSYGTVGGSPKEGGAGEGGSDVLALESGSYYASG